MKKILAVIIISLCALSLLAGCDTKSTEEPGGKKIVFQADFAEDSQGFEPIFADYSIDDDGLDKYGMEFRYDEIPVSGEESYGLYIASSNRSDDIFMGYVKELAGFDASTEYTFDISFKLATKVEGGLMGIGGSPGEAVFVKTGIASEYPIVGTAEDGVERIINVDIGSQSQGGNDLAVVGDMTKPDGVAEGFVFKEISIACTAKANAEGHVYLIIGTDSGFEGFTEYYLDDITVMYMEKYETN